MSGVAAPVFVLAAPMSGADVLTAMLGCHPQFCALPQTHLFMAEGVEDLLEIFRIGQGDHADGLLRALAQLLHDQQTDAAVTEAKDWLAAHKHQTVDAVLAQLAACAAPRRLVLVETASTLRPAELERMRRHHPQAQYLHLLRHPWSQGVILANRWNDRLFVPVDYKDHYFSPPLLDPQIPWFRANRNLLEHIAQLAPRQALRMGWEALISDSASTLGEICRWLDVSDDADTLKRMQRYEQWAFWGHGPPSAAGGLDAESLEQIPDRVMDHAFFGPRLDRILPWRPDGKGFMPEVIALAREFAYE
jgi:hypothetical protein